MSTKNPGHTLCINIKNITISFGDLEPCYETTTLGTSLKDKFIILYVRTYYNCVISMVVLLGYFIVGTGEYGQPLC